MALQSWSGNHDRERLSGHRIRWSVDISVVGGISLEWYTEACNILTYVIKNRRNLGSLKPQCCPVYQYLKNPTPLSQPRRDTAETQKGAVDTTKTPNRQNIHLNQTNGSLYITCAYVDLRESFPQRRKIPSYQGPHTPLTRGHPHYRSQRHSRNARCSKKAPLPTHIIPRRYPSRYQ